MRNLVKCVSILRQEYQTCRRLLRALEMPRTKYLIKKSEQQDIDALTKHIVDRDVQAVLNWSKYHREVPLEDLPTARLRQMCVDRNIPYMYCDKSNLVERILSYDAAQEASEENGDA